MMLSGGFVLYKQGEFEVLHTDPTFPDEQIIWIH